jgi:hypothetical protein
LIRDKIARQPGAPYYMAQTIVVQEQALRLRKRDWRNSGASCSGITGEWGRFRQACSAIAAKRRRSAGSVPRVGSLNRNRCKDSSLAAASSRRAAQTALGVTGGVLLGNAIAECLAVMKPKRQNQQRIKAPKIKKSRSRKKKRIREEADFVDGGPTSVTSTWTSEPRQMLKRGQIESLHLKRRGSIGDHPAEFGRTYSPVYVRIDIADVIENALPMIRAREHAIT